MQNFKINGILKYKNSKFHHLPTVIFIGDNNTSYNQVIPNLPKKKSAIILRMYNKLDRRLIAEKLAHLRKKYQFKLLVAGDPKLALKIQADGLHISESSFFDLRKWKKMCPNWIITATAHNEKRLIEIRNYGLTAAIYSPIFSTITHPERNHIGTLKFMKHTNKLNFPVYALGGINKNNILQLKNSNIIGIAGIRIFNTL